VASKAADLGPIVVKNPTVYLTAKDKETVMHVRGYLKESIRKAEGFEEKEKRGSEGEYKQLRFKGDYLYQDGEVLWIELKVGNLERFPDWLREHSDFISLTETLPDRPRRIPGVYRTSDGVVAEVERHSQFNKAWDSYYVRIVGKDPKAVLLLLNAIRSGTVEPTESWDNDQPSRPLADIEKDLEEMRAQRDQLQTALIKAQKHIEWISSLRAEYEKVQDKALATLSEIYEKLTGRYVVRAKPLRDLIGKTFAALH